MSDFAASESTRKPLLRNCVSSSKLEGQKLDEELTAGDRADSHPHRSYLGPGGSREPHPFGGPSAADPSAAMPTSRCAEMLWSARCVTSSLHQDDERLHFALLLSRPRPCSTGNYAPPPTTTSSASSVPECPPKSSLHRWACADSERKRPTAASVDTEIEFSYLAHRRQPGMYVPPTEAALGYSVHRRPPSAPHPKRAKNQPQASQLTWSGRSPTASPCPT